MSKYFNDFLNRAKTYERDYALFKSVGFDLFDIEVNAQHFVGTYKTDSGGKIDVWVMGFPALSWKAKIVGGDTLETTILSTGSGALSDYWPTFLLFAEEMIGVINGIE